MQPSELAKIAFAIWGAHLLAARRLERASLRELLVPLVPAAVIALALIVAQPDLGQTVSLGIILLGLLWYAGLPLRVFGAHWLAVVVAGAILAMSAGYRSDRVRSWLDPENDPQDTGYQARQAKYALAHGGIFGDGLGQGVAKWNYLPNAHNDFIFAIIGEELGFVGAFGLLGLFGLFAYTGMRIARRSADPFLRLLTATTTIWVLGQAFINIGYVIGMLPVTGLQLPLISAGGTSTATTLFMIGIMINAARHEPEAVAALRAGRDDKVNRLLRLPLPEPYLPSRLEAFRDRIQTRPKAAKAAGRGKPHRPEKSQRPRRITPSGRSARSPGKASWIWPAVRRPASYWARSRIGRSALRVNDTISQPAGGQGASPSPAGAASSVYSTLSVVLAGGGTAGHVEPAMAVADALSALDPQVRITVLGTKRGLETRLVPERGYHLELITPVPLPRKPNWDLARLPPRVWRAVRESRAVLDAVDADVVIGFGGYVALPAYLAAHGFPGILHRRRRIPVVIHEANARAGIANRVGARTADRILTAVPDSGFRRAEVVGVPVRAAITALDRAALRAEARKRFGFADDARVLLVFGGSQGAVAAQPRRVGGRRRAGRRGRGGAARARAQKHPRTAHTRPWRSAVCGGALPGPDGSGVRRRRPGDLPIRRDDRRRSVGRRTAGHLRAAADRQRRAAAQRAAGGQRRRRHDRRRCRPDPRPGGAAGRWAAQRPGPAGRDDGGRRAGGTSRGGAPGGRGGAGPSKDSKKSGVAETPVNAEQLPPELRRVHMVGIGGAGMSGIARILLDREGMVSGSDAKESRGLHALRARGAEIRIGHDASSLDLLPGGPTAVITTHAAIPKTNPELVEARRRGIPVILRPTVLARLMAGRTTLMVTGTHGKTTTTSMLIVALQHCGRDPSFAVGGELGRPVPTPTTAAVTASSPRPTKATARCWSTRPTSRW